MSAIVNFDLLIQHLQERFRHPTALAAAISEVYDCRRYETYLIAVLVLHPNETPSEAVFKHACARALQWEPFQASTATQQSLIDN